MPSSGPSARRTNLALLVLVPGAVLTRAKAFALGAPPWAVVAAAAHGTWG